MRILICDDDPLMVEQLKQYCKMFFDKIHVKCPEVACFSDGVSLLADKGDKDILFLDIEMPGMSGIYVGNELKKTNSNIIIFIVTSYPEYLDAAMRFQVFRYLSKPVDKQRFLRNMKDAVELYNAKTHKIPVETKQGVHTIAASCVIAIEAQARKVIVHTTLGDFESVHNMLYWEKQLPKNCFFQTHRSFIPASNEPSGFEGDIWRVPRGSDTPLLAAFNFDAPLLAAGLLTVNFEHITDFDHTLVNMAGNQIRAYLTKRKYSAFKESYLLYLESTR